MATPPERSVLVTGADGLIGRAVVDALTRAGRTVSALSRTWSSPTSAARVFTGDAADEELVRRAVQGIDAVVHLAAIPHPNLGTPRQVFVGNTSATFTVLNSAGEAGIRRAVVASSINAFGVPLNRHDTYTSHYPLDIDEPVEHDDAYSLSKWVDERIAAWAYSRWEIDSVAFRFPLVRPAAELRLAADRLREQPGEQARLAREGWAYLELSDAVDAIVRALDVPLSGAHTLMLAAEDTLLAEPTDSLLDRFAPHSRRRTTFPGRTAPIDTSAARELLGWAPTHTVLPLDPSYQETPA
ncbi:Nucleoside-diphosphate-sugar epimerase [Leifsonia sp. 21MFCrub1.1]|nr:Nucleoside-diphosphate-sugar epimerase [Leifsonia sp. 21MFCrub1.1]